MNPLKKFKECYERRHRIWKGILWIVGVISPSFLFLVLFAMLSGVRFGGMLYVFGVVVFGLFVLATLGFGWEHPKWYVKLYAGICTFWELLCWAFFGWSTF